MATFADLTVRNLHARFVQAMEIRYLPPYSPDLNPLEAGYAGRSNRCGNTCRGRPITCVAWLAAHAIALRLGIATIGLPMLAIRLNSGDPWD